MRPARDLEIFSQLRFDNKAPYQWNVRAPCRTTIYRIHFSLLPINNSSNSLVLPQILIHYNGWLLRGTAWNVCNPFLPHTRLHNPATTIGQLNMPQMITSTSLHNGTFCLQVCRFWPVVQVFIVYIFILCVFMFPVLLKALDYIVVFVFMSFSAVFIWRMSHNSTAQNLKVWWSLCEVDIYKAFFTPELWGIEAKLCFSWIIWFEMNISAFRPISIFGWPAQI